MSAHTGLTPDMAELEIGKEHVPNSCWDENLQHRLRQLRDYYKNMACFCERLLLEGPTEAKPTDRPHISINEFLKNPHVQRSLSDTQQGTASEHDEPPAKRTRAQSRESEESLKQLSEYLQTKICQDEATGWRGSDMQCDTIDELLTHIRKGKQYNFSK